MLERFKGYRTYFAATGAILAGAGAVITAVTVGDYNAAMTAASATFIGVAQIFQRAAT